MGLRAFRVYRVLGFIGFGTLHCATQHLSNNCTRTSRAKAGQRQARDFDASSAPEVHKKRKKQHGIETQCSSCSLRPVSGTDCAEHDRRNHKQHQQKGRHPQELFELHRVRTGGFSARASRKAKTAVPSLSETPAPKPQKPETLKPKP